METTRRQVKPSLISFVVRSYNEERHLGQLLETVAAQASVPARVEVIVVDSGSTDRTVAIARKHGVKLIEIPKDQFNYGTALNLGIQASSGGIVAILSAHAIPRTHDWLERMVAHFGDDRLAGVYCREVPWPEANWREVRRLGEAFGLESRLYDAPAAGNVPFSNAASCIRRTVWELHPFAALPYSEDVEWANWAVSHGYRIAYEAGASVYHSHNESCRQIARRLINIEKSADVANSRSRGLFLTLRQAAGRAFRDVRYVLRLRNPEPSRCRLVWDALACAYWFFRDFKVS